MLPYASTAEGWYLRRPWGRTKRMSGPKGQGIAQAVYSSPRLLMETNDNRAKEDAAYNRDAFAKEEIPEDAGGRYCVDSVFANIMRRLYKSEKKLNKLTKQYGELARASGGKAVQKTKKV